MTRHPVLRPGDLLRLGGATHTVAGLDGVTVRLADVTGAVTEVLTAGLLADPSLELVTASRVPLAPQPALDRLPAGTVEAARWWERHLIEVITGVPPDSPPGTRPRPDYDPAGRSLRQRELAKHDELTRAGHRVGLSTLKRLRVRYEREGLRG
jgi:putative transposase